jgi:hypothetical protein
VPASGNVATLLGLNNLYVYAAIAHYYVCGVELEQQYPAASELLSREAYIVKVRQLPLKPSVPTSHTAVSRYQQQQHALREPVRRLADGVCLVNPQCACHSMYVMVAASVAVETCTSKYVAQAPDYVLVRRNMCSASSASFKFY